MSTLLWDQVGEKVFETGVDHGVLYLRDQTTGDYAEGYVWNGLTTVTESPEGAESNKQYADNIVYANIKSAETYGATIEAFMYPPEFERCDGSAGPVPGVSLGQQNRESFGFSYRTQVGNDLDSEAGYKLHLVYGADAAPSEKTHATVNDSPELAAFSWDVTTVPVAVSGTDPVTGKDYKPTATLEIDSRLVDADALAALEELLYGTEGDDARLPLPDEVLALFAGTINEVFPTAPTYNNATHTLTIPAVTGVIYSIDGEVQTSGAHVITEDTIVTARPAAGYSFSGGDDDWFFDFS